MRQSKYSQEFKDSTVQLIINNNESVVKLKLRMVFKHYPFLVKYLLQILINENPVDLLNWIFLLESIEMEFIF